jgi:hypothetical protein
MAVVASPLLTPFPARGSDQDVCESIFETAGARERYRTYVVKVKGDEPRFRSVFRAVRPQN